MAEDKVVDPVVGMGVTGHKLDGKVPYTIIEVVDSKTLRIQEDRATRVGDGRVDHQEYKYEADPRGRIKTIVQLSLIKKSDKERVVFMWYEQGADPKKSLPFSVGERRKYHDYSSRLVDLWRS
jgi:hypothetical protein